MIIAKKIINKTSNIRKQTWSAPAVMILFLFFCMLLVYSFESIGIFRKETNLEYRTLYFNNGMKIFQNLFFKNIVITELDIRTNANKKNNKELSEKVVVQTDAISNKVKIDSQISKEKNLQKMMNMMFNGIDPDASNMA